MGAVRENLNATFICGLHSLLQDSTDRRAYLNWLVANKRIDAHDLSHTFTVARIRGGANGLLWNRFRDRPATTPTPLLEPGLIAIKMAAVDSFCQPV